MPTYIELHLLTFFIITALIEQSIKQIMKTKAKGWAICLCAAVFAVIKFLMDYFCTGIIAQLAVIFFYFLSSNLLLHKFSHITKLVSSMLVCIVFYFVSAGFQIVFSKFLNIQTLYAMSNFYLLTLLGFCMISFWVFALVREYILTNKSIKLSKLATFKIDQQNITLKGFIDTGNNLVDKQSGLGVVIVNINSIKKFVSNKVYADILFCTNSSGELEQIHKIKYSTISGTDFITVFRPKNFIVSGRNIDCMIGITFSSFTNDYEAIMPAICL